VEVLLGGVVAAVVAALVALWTHRREARQRDELLNRELEYQTRSALRETYGALLVKQRKSREASLRLALDGGSTHSQAFDREAVAAHDEFTDVYHQLNLDSSRSMWLEARGLRAALDDMLRLAQVGDAKGCEDAADLARDARQNLERSFRERLGYDAHQVRRPLGKYDKVEPPPSGQS